MKLKNKRTGEIATLTLSSNGEELLLMKNNEMVTRNVKLSDLEEWEDVPEEPKEYWFINDLDGTPMKCELRSCVRDFTEWREKRKQIGNYFETEEEADNAVVKLKAWKWLKDKGFRFDGWDENHHNLGIIEFSFDKVENNVWDFEKDLDLLFNGGEE